MKKNTLAAMLLLATMGTFSSASHAALTVVFGKPLEVFADPSDVVVFLDTAGPCGSKFFHVRRANANFKELTALMLTAFTGGKTLRLFVDPATCVGDRNVVNHSGMF